mgnify:CR=1 FL=1
MGLTPKRADESATEMVQVVLPNDANPLGFMLGGVTGDVLGAGIELATTGSLLAAVATA